MYLLLDADILMLVAELSGILRQKCWWIRGQAGKLACGYASLQRKKDTRIHIWVGL